MQAVRMEQLEKIYEGGKRALHNINITLRPGEVFGFLGPNGAGKTTAVKLINGMLAPTAGSCRVFDMDPAVKPEEVHRISGVVTEHAQMYDKLTGLQNLVFYGNVFGFSEAESRSRGLDLLEKLSLPDAKDRKLETYSTGMRQRLSLARAMMHRPRLLFLDEPTSGLDPESTKQVNLLIQRLAQEEGITIFLCTHQLRYAQEICSSYGLIDEGELLAAGSLDSLRNTVSAGITVRIEADRLPEGLAVRQDKGQHYEITVQKKEEIPQIVRRIVECGGNVSHVSAHSMSLEEIYFALIRRRGKKGANTNE